MSPESMYPVNSASAVKTTWSSCPTAPPNSSPKASPSPSKSPSHELNCIRLGAAPSAFEGAEFSLKLCKLNRRSPRAATPISAVLGAPPSVFEGCSFSSNLSLHRNGSRTYTLGPEIRLPNRLAKIHDPLLRPKPLRSTLRRYICAMPAMLRWHKLNRRILLDLRCQKRHI